MLDSDFSSLPAVLGEGRRVVNNITRVAGVFFVKTIYSVLLSVVCLLLNIPFPFVPIQITLIDLIIEAYPAFFMSFEPDKRKVTGRFLPSVMQRAIPNAVSILICFLVLLCLSLLVQIPAEQVSILLYLLVGTVGIQAVLKASYPFNKLRIFLCASMTAGFYAAVFLLHSILQVALPAAPTLLLFVGFVLLSFLIERGGTGNHPAVTISQSHIKLNIKTINLIFVDKESIRLMTDGCFLCRIVRTFAFQFNFIL